MTELPGNAERPEPPDAADEPAPPAGEKPPGEPGAPSAWRSIRTGAKAGFTVALLLWPAAVVVELALHNAVASATRDIDRLFSTLFLGSFMAAIPGALAGGLGGLARHPAIGALAGAVTGFCWCVPPMALMGLTSPGDDVPGNALAISLLMIDAFGAVCGACGAIAARSWVKPEGVQGRLQFSIGDLLILMSLLATLVGCVAYLARQ